jgi:hypothetical protein
MSEKINVLIGANIEGLKAALAESGKSLSEFGTLAQQAPKKAKTAVDELNKSYRDAVTDAKNLALMQGQTSEAFYEAQLKAKNLKTQIQQLNEVVGQTGQIAAGSGGVQQASHKFDMLGHSVNQITRELPAFTNSMTTGFMAISNNIPMFVDQINNIRTANAALIAQGQPVQSVFSQLATSLFSWQTALSLGVTLLTVYGAEMINALDATVEMAKANERLAETTKRLEDQEQKIIDIVRETADLRVQAMAEGRKKEEAIAAHSYKKQLDDITASFQKNEIAEYTYRQRAKYLFQIYQNELAEIEKKANEKRQKERVKIDKALEEGLDYKNQIKKFKGQLAVDLKKMPVPQVGKIEFLIDTTNAMTRFDIFKMDFLSTLDDIEKRIGKWSEVIAGSLSNALTGLGSTLMSKEEDKWKDYSKMLLGLLGDLAIQIGGALIALGIPMAMAGVPTGFVYLAAGSALLIAGGALKAGSVPGQDSGNSSSQNPQSTSSQGNIPSFNPTGMMISIDGMVRGNNIVVALDNQTRMNRRVR